MSEELSHTYPKYTPPEKALDGFHCPHCGVYSKQNWYMSSTFFVRSNYGGSIYQNNRYSFAVCDRCGDISFWLKEKIIYPSLSLAPRPHEDIPTEIIKLYKEAREIYNSSPRASSALLRLSMEKLAEILVNNTENKTTGSLNENIGFLVKKGMKATIQKAMDSLRVIGNDAVHPGQIDFNDDRDTALKLFNLLNIVVEDRITQVREIENLYNEKVPETKKKQIEERDLKTSDE